MTSINLEKTIKHLKFQESLQSENRTEYCLCKGILYIFFPMLMPA